VACQSTIGKVERPHAAVETCNYPDFLAETEDQGLAADSHPAPPLRLNIE
jgi:hypothetical protein